MGSCNVIIKLEGWPTIEEAFRKIKDSCEPLVRPAIAIEFLRKDEADTVTILCDNPDGPPNNAIEVGGFWTEWETRRFEGDTLVEALEAAGHRRRRRISSSQQGMINFQITANDNSERPAT